MTFAKKSVALAFYFLRLKHCGVLRCIRFCCSPSSFEASFMLEPRNTNGMVDLTNSKRATPKTPKQSFWGNDGVNARPVAGKNFLVDYTPVN